MKRKYKPTGRWLFERGRVSRVSPKAKAKAKAGPRRIVIDFAEPTLRELLACIRDSKRTGHLARIAEKMIVEALGERLK
jgi:hypothetical protein